MSRENKIQLFQKQSVRTHWDEEQEKWYFSVIDVVGILSESVNPQAYWRKLKQRLKKEGNESVTNCHALKMVAQDGKMRMTDVANTETLLRQIQTVSGKLKKLSCPHFCELISITDTLERGFYKQQAINENSTQCVEFLARLTLECCYE